MIPTLPLFGAMILAVGFRKDSSCGLCITVSLYANSRIIRKGEMRDAPDEWRIPFYAFTWVLEKPGMRRVNGMRSSFEGRAA